MNKFRSIYLLLIVALIGLGDATYLTIMHYVNRIPECSIIHGCEIVLTSQYATIAGVPISAAGALFYALMFTLLYGAISGPTVKNMKFPMLLATAGMIVTLVLLYIQTFVIKAYCQFCVLSAITSFCLFIGILPLYLKLKKNIQLPPNSTPNPGI